MLHSLVNIRSLWLTVVTLIGIAILSYVFFQVELVDSGAMLVFCIFFIFLPGYALIRLVQDESWTLLESLVASNGVGLAFLCYAFYVIRIKLMLSTWWLVPTVIVATGACAYWWWRKARSWTHTVRAEQPSSIDSRLLPVFLWVALALAFSWMINGTKDGDVSQYYSTVGREGMWHIGYMSAIQSGSPFSDIHQNFDPFIYHFFSHVPAIILNDFFNVNFQTSYFKLVAFWAFFFLVAGSYAATWALFRKRLPALWTVLAVLFLDNPSALAMLSRLSAFSALNQIDLGPTIISAIRTSQSHTVSLLLFSAIVLICKKLISDEPSPRMTASVIVGFLIGSLIGVKINAFMVVAASLVFLAIFEVVRARSLTGSHSLRIGFLALVFSFPFLLDLIALSRTRFVWNFGYFPFRSELAISLKNVADMGTAWTAIGFLALFVCYVILHFGPRLIVVPGLFKGVVSPDYASRLTAICAFTGILMTLTIVPKDDPYNSMYFHRFGVFCATLFFGTRLVEIFRRSFRRFVFVMIFVIFYSLGGLDVFFKPRVIPDFTVSNEKVEVLQKLHSGQPPKKILSGIFSDRQNDGTERNWIYSAFSGQIALSEGILFTSARLADSSVIWQRRSDIARFYSTNDSDEAIRILDNHHIDYVIVDHEFGQMLNFKDPRLVLLEKRKSISLYAYAAADIDTLASN